MSNLTPKQEKFCQEYILGGNATQAAKKAGYKGSDRQLTVIGSQNLAKLSISKKIAAHQKKLANKFSDDFEDKRSKLIRNYEAAHELGQIGAANGAIAELNRMDGDHAVFRQSIETPDGNPLTLFIQQLSGNTIEPNSN